ncbi:MAG: hypothetical protein JRH01_20295 [Deltaproteobacteria bacterium]|nr:hypothetical protein [Deltaproteobacteria bacterium]
MNRSDGTSLRIGTGAATVAACAVVVTVVLHSCMLAPPAGADTEPASTGAAPAKAFVHAPYAKRNCRECHETDDGQVLKTPKGGLCLASCHTELLGRSEFRHGPVNLEACLPCHEYHESEHPGLLVEAGEALCYRCHLRRDFASTSHLDSTVEGACTDCHDPHRGDDSLFLRQGRGE